MTGGRVMAGPQPASTSARNEYETAASASARQVAGAPSATAARGITVALVRMITSMKTEDANLRRRTPLLSGTSRTNPFIQARKQRRAPTYFAGLTSIARASVCLMTISSPFLTSLKRLTLLSTFMVAVFCCGPRNVTVRVL